MVLPEMVRDLQLNYTLVGVITGVSHVSTLLSVPIAGFLTSRYGGLRLLVGIQLLGSILLGSLYFSQGFISLFIINFLIRAWPVMTWIPLVSIAVEHIDFKWRGTMLAAVSSSACFFVFVDGQISSYFLEHFNWRIMWLAVAIICLISSLISWISLKLIGCWQVVTYHSNEKKKQSYIAVLAWLKSRSGIVINILFLITGLTYVAFQNYLAAYLRDELGLGLDLTAVIWTVMGISGVFGGLVIGLVTDRFGVRTSMIFVFSLSFLAALILCFPVSPFYCIVMAVLFGVAQAAVYGLGPTYISKTLPGELAANAFTFSSLVLSIGVLLGNFLGGWSNSLTGTFWWLYVIEGVLFALGALLSLLLVSEKQVVT